MSVDAGRCYIVTDFLQGLTLHRWLNEHTPIWQEAARITAAVAEALAYAHAHRTVHRDVKPENIMLIEGVMPVLVDFGLGLTEADVSGAGGLVAGTVPLHVAGAGSRRKSSDRRSDGHLFFGGRLVSDAMRAVAVYPPRTKGTDAQIVYDDPQPPRQLVPSLPRQLEAICLKALEKEQSTPLHGCRRHGGRTTPSVGIRVGRSYHHHDAPVRNRRASDTAWRALPG